jgi:hypothetical protein
MLGSGVTVRWFGWCGSGHHRVLSGADLLWHHGQYRGDGQAEFDLLMIPEMELLDISLTKHSSLLLQYIEGKSRKKKTRVCLWIATCRRKNEGRKPDKNSSLRRLEFTPRNPKMPFKNSISAFFSFLNWDSPTFSLWSILLQLSLNCWHFISRVSNEGSCEGFVRFLSLVLRSILFSCGFIAQWSQFVRNNHSLECLLSGFECFVVRAGCTIQDVKVCLFSFGTIWIREVFLLRWFPSWTLLYSAQEYCNWLTGYS